MCRPANPSTAGTSVTEASIVMSTVSEVPMANPRIMSMPMKNMPRKESTTVVPAKSTARPAVLVATTTASRGRRPPASPSRYLVTMKSA